MSICRKHEHMRGLRTTTLNCDSLPHLRTLALSKLQKLDTVRIIEGKV